MSQLVMVIDQKRCIGCHSCTIACKLENNMPKGLSYTHVYTNKVPKSGETELPMDMPLGTHSIDGDFTNSPLKQNLTMKYYTKGCQHCDEPPCVKACPYEATYKREKDGLVVIDYAKCIGCNACVTACPFNSRIIIADEAKYYEGVQTTPIGGQGIPPHRKGTVEKCTFCKHLVDDGKKPACVDACPARARFVGEKDNPSNEIYEMLNDGTRTVEQLFSDDDAAKAAKPSVYFLK